MARIPPIAQAQIIRAPGVFDYAMREGPNIAGAFTAGLAAGSRIKEAKTAEKERGQARADRLAEREASLVERFGGDAVLDPESGTVDIAASGKRRQLGEIAAAAGESYGMGFAPDGLTPEIMELPQFKAGAARGAAKMRADEMQMERADARERAIAERMLEVDKQRNESRERMAADERSGDLLRTLLTPRGGGRTASEDTVTITEGGGDTGKPRVSRKMSPEEFDAYQKRQAEAAAAAAMEQQDAPIQAALDEIARMEAMGKKPSITRDANGNPKVIDSWFFGETVTPAMKAALQGQLKRNRSAPTPTPSSPRPVKVEELGIKIDGGSRPAEPSTFKSAPEVGQPKTEPELLDMLMQEGLLEPTVPAPQQRSEPELWKMLYDAGLVGAEKPSNPRMSAEEVLASELRQNQILTPLIRKENLGPFQDRQPQRKLTKEQEEVVRRILDAKEGKFREQTMAELLQLK